MKDGIRIDKTFQHTESGMAFRNRKSRQLSGLNDKKSLPNIMFAHLHVSLARAGKYSGGAAVSLREGHPATFQGK